MRYSAAAFITAIGLFFAFMGSATRYQLLLSLNRFVRGGDMLGYETLRAENAALKSALSSVRFVGDNIPQKDGALIFADVFAAYPFTGRSLVRVNKGAVDGMRVGYPATFGGSVLAGQVTEVHNRYSIVRMVGSPEWQIPVRVGPHKVAGLLVGGTIPRISMLAADKPIAVGDSIVAASNDLPYGLTIGAISSLSVEAAGGVFQDAVVTFSYDARDVAELAFMVWTSD
jgi:cell shape-determining protein MreC